jgi:D-proline reductase (dithiol) PrdB
MPNKMIKNTRRLKNRSIAKLVTFFPSLSKKLLESYSPPDSTTIPWTGVTKPLNETKWAVVTTAGVHHIRQKPFDMNDPNGDPSYRALETKDSMEWMITHDYYDHSGADKDKNIVFPIDRLKEFESEGLIGALADTNYSFMGHITGDHIDSLINTIAPEVAAKLKADGADAVLLTPG